MDKKVLLIIALLTVVLLFGGVFLVSKSKSPASIEKTSGATIETSHKDYDFKDIKYDGGNVSHAFPVRNSGSKDLILANFSTSCMCTQVYFKKGDEKSPSFGMKGHTVSDWKGLLKPKEEAEVVVVFDPTAHGPQGIGPASRFVSFETNDPENPYIEFGFTGVVVK